MSILCRLCPVPLATINRSCKTQYQPQTPILFREHTGVEARCQAAYNNALAVGSSLCDAVEAASGAKMQLAHVSQEQALAGFPSSTFSFNLPPPEGNSW